MKLSPFQGIIDQSMLTNKLLGTMNTNMANFISEMRNVSSAPIREINQEIEKTPSQIGSLGQDILGLTDKLKETEARLRAIGETAKANKIKEMLKTINLEATDVKSSMVELRQYIEKTFGTDILKQFDKELKNIDKSTQKVGKKSNFGSNLKTALGIGTVALGIRKAFDFVKSSTTESIDFVETQNLFNVSMGKTVDQYGNLDREASKYYTKAMAFQEKVSDKLKINIEESMEYQALFNAMSKSMGIGDEPSYKISENFTKLGYDLSSLYNIDPENAMQKLRAGLSGQTKPLRDLGLDITQQSLEPLLDELGIERSTKQLSQAEKMIARYIVVLRQASLAHGDFAKTMDSPANQLRIFNAQITAFKRNMGNLWQGLLGNILPYVNAIMMVINELLKMVAKLFGFEVSDQNVNISAGIGTDDLVDDLGTATGKAKELKKQLMGFDEINNITLPDKSSGGSGGASVGGIDQRLLDAMKEYDNMMDKVKSKATDIKNQIMKWLGFTGDTVHDMERLKKIINTIKIATGIIGTLFLTWKITKFLGDLSNALKNIKELVNLLPFLKKPIFIGITMTLALIGFAKSIDDKYKIDEQAWKPLYDALGFEYSNDLSVANWITRFKIIFKAIDLGIKEDAIGKLREVIFDKIGKVFTDFTNWVQGKWSDFTNWVSNIPSKLGYYAGEVAGSIYLFFTKTIPQVWSDFTNWLSSKWSDFTNWLSSLPGKIWQGLCNIGNEVEKFFTKTIPQVWSDFTNWIKTLPEKFVQFGKNVIQGLINGVQSAWSGFWKAITDFIEGFVQGVKDKLGIHSPSTVFEGFGENIIQGLKQGIQNKIEEIKNKIFEVAGNIKEWFSNSISNISSKGQEILEKIQEGINKGKLGLSSKISEIAGNVKGWFSGSLGNLSNIGANIVSGISSGINSAKSKLMSTVQSLASNVPDWAKKILHINSPSRVMRDMVGKFIPLGVAEGIDKNADSVYSSIKKLNNGINKEFIVNPNDFKIDTNQFIDYGQISGAIATQNNIEVDSNIEGRIENAIYRGLSNATIPIEIEATTDEGVVFKKVQVKAREFYTQTGEPAFDF